MASLSSIMPGASALNAGVTQVLGDWNTLEVSLFTYKHI